MATPSIGGITFVEMLGALPSNPASRVAEITRPGVDGHAFQDIGKRGTPIQVITRADVSSPSSSESAYRAKIKTLVSVVSPGNRTVTLCLVLDVVILEEKTVALPVGGLTAGATYFTAQWTLLPTMV